MGTDGCQKGWEREYRCQNCSQYKKVSLEVCKEVPNSTVEVLTASDKHFHGGCELQLTHMCNKYDFQISLLHLSKVFYYVLTISSNIISKPHAHIACVLLYLVKRIVFLSIWHYSI